MTSHGKKENTDSEPYQTSTILFRIIPSEENSYDNQKHCKTIEIVYISVKRNILMIDVCTH